MISISLCMIVKNEENTLDRCLNSTGKLFDEIIIVDTGSNDNTKKIARKYTDKIYDFKWCDDFAKARNFSLSKATKEYIMWLDADDVILEKDFKKLYKLKKTLKNDVDIVMLKYDLNLDENRTPSLSYYRERIIRNNREYKWISPIHEAIVTRGNIEYRDISITHSKIHASEPKRNLKIFEKMKKHKTTFDARQTFYYARELYYDKQYEEAILNYNAFLEMDDAWVENKISACIDLHFIYLLKKDSLSAMSVLLKTLEFDIPRAETCCHIASIFMNNKKYDMAIYWYKEALSKDYDDKSGGFYNRDYYNFIPYIELCVCYFNISDIKSAIYYNKLAGNIRPNNISYLKNVEFFKSLKNSQVK